MKNVLSYLPIVLLLGLLALMQFTSYEEVDQLPILKGEAIVWKAQDLNEALELSQNLEQPIFINFHAKWCRPCKMLKSMTFPRESVAGILNQRYINLNVDVDSPKGMELRRKYEVRSFPTMLVLNKEGEEISRKEGFTIAPILANWLKEAHKVYKGEGI